MKNLEDLKVKSKMEFVYFDDSERVAVRVDAWGEECGRHQTGTPLSMKFFIGWLAVYQQTEKKEFIFLFDKEDLKKINFKK